MPSDSLQSTSFLSEHAALAMASPTMPWISVFFEAQLILHFPCHVCSSEHRARHSEDTQGREVVCQVTLQQGVDVPPGLIVQHHGLDLCQRAKHQEDMKNLMALPKKIAFPREQLLWVRMGEKKGTDEEEQHLTLVVQQGRVRVLRR